MSTTSPAREEVKQASSSNIFSRLGLFASSPSHASTTNKNKILIVDDVVTNRKLLARMLPGSLCVEAVNGYEAVQEVKKALDKGAPFDLILMDMEMPLMDGQTATQEIRKLGSLVPIICVSTNIKNQEEFATLTSGMNGFLNKPVKKAELDLLVKKYSSSSTASLSSENKENTADTNPVGDRATFNRYHLLFSMPATVPIDIPFKEEPASPVSLSSMGLAASPEGQLPSLLISPPANQLMYSMGLVR